MKNMIDKDSIDICKYAGLVSNEFEQNNSQLKREYLIWNINLINGIMQSVEGYRGSFGTGYPFYVLDKNLEGDLPIIKEQFRYNNALVRAAVESGLDRWTCGSCLRENYDDMVDLKVICNPCRKIEDALKPRKVMNRLPDVDMWMVCDDCCIEEAKEKLTLLFEQNNMHTSDVDPVGAIYDMALITSDLNALVMPTRALPLDVHIIEYSKFLQAVELVPLALLGTNENSKPLVPIQPTSLRKRWQCDDAPYDFAFDFLFSLTTFNLDSNLEEKINAGRNIISSAFSEEELYDILQGLAQDSVKRRLETKQLQKRYLERMRSWK